MMLNLKADSETLILSEWALGVLSYCLRLPSRRTARQLQPQFKTISSLAVTVDVHI